ncbi:type II toxin-antitoxin system HicB family antitoxin [Candidatus Daviesbacteria bacterium]|nr:type II toxin-antitoxin system HicB family antitoxin [Candidatus Daviesbacteria bacterium]
MKTRILKYTVIYTPEPEGGFTVNVPQLPGCVTYGKDLNEAKKMAKDAISLYLQSLKKHNESIPQEENSFIGSIDLEFPQAHA